MLFINLMILILPNIPKGRSSLPMPMLQGVRVTPELSNQSTRSSGHAHHQDSTLLQTLPSHEELVTFKGEFVPLSRLDRQCRERMRKLRNTLPLTKSFFPTVKQQNGEIEIFKARLGICTYLSRSIIKTDKEIYLKPAYTFTMCTLLV
jgi:hypothetical protein